MNNIPDYNNNILPPYIGEEGDETIKGNLSPYKCDLLSFCKRFGNNKKRVEILKSFIMFRKRLIENNISYGFQWVFGSFVEDTETYENRSPKDVDIITFFMGIDQEKKAIIQKSFPEFFNNERSKYNVDHSAFQIDFSPEYTVEILSDAMQLCTHTRLGEWKGIVRLELNTPENDKLALDYLENF